MNKESNEYLKKKIKEISNLLEKLNDEIHKISKLIN
tara:strand:- start:4412 stop:4519 length:108 start_codon:yes stop_codon:yes gene_type:complete